MLSPVRNRGFRGKPGWAQKLTGLSLSMPSFWWLVRLQPEAVTSHRLLPAPGVFLLFSLFPLLPVGHFPNFLASMPEVTEGKVPLGLPPCPSQVIRSRLQGEGVLLGRPLVRGTRGRVAMQPGDLSQVGWDTGLVGEKRLSNPEHWTSPY